ncbi:MAG: hypothetical protein F9K15_18415 [Zoogloea sp.]|nr:MAG: hypothetical protein F9K15_18415 [Zoogloea sp.]
MTSITLIWAVHILLCLHLLITVFARAVATSRHVYADVRLVFVVLGGVAMYGLVAPLVMPWSPDSYSIAITAAVCAVQHVTARHWHSGVPAEFFKPDYRPRRRATDRK